jgi:kumamolisin
VSEQHPELTGSDRALPAGARRVGTPDPDEQVEVTVTLRGPGLPDPQGPVTPVAASSYADDYGAAPADAAKVEEELRSRGLQVYDVSLADRSLHARGTIAQLNAAFGVELGLYQSGTHGEFRGREGNITIPAPLDGIVTGVFGLDNRRVAHRRTTTAQPAPPALTPPEFEARYQFPNGDAAGQVVAIAEFGGLIVPGDVQAFCQKYGRPVPTVTPVAVGGAKLLTLAEVEQLPKQQQQEVLDESVEVMMDIEIVAALCPAATIPVYFAPFSEKGWIDLLNAVLGAAPVPVALSVSWGLYEDSTDWSAAAVREISQRLQALALRGITVCVAAGDDGAGDGADDGKAHVDFPASSPWVLAVGGTMLNAAAQQEVVWWQSPGERAEGGGATGGGVSTIFPRPAWQTVQVASLNQGSINGRVIPDVAALAGPPYYDLIFLGKDSPNGGTSAAAPLWASMLARVTAGLPAADRPRFLTPLLYGAAQAGGTLGQETCSDITSGDNASPGVPGGYAAGTGYDAVSGWGTPIGVKLQQLLS